ncbi:FitA-like ribbon-helix-helix domain-containing protein [Azotobacter armeniacus]
MFNSDAPAGKVTVRNLPAEVISALGRLAEQHDRSLEAEARQAIRAWVQPQIESEKRTSRAVSVGQRLRYLQNEIGELRTSKAATPSRLAEAMGWSHAEKIESWLAGDEEPSFDELTQISALVGCQRDWLVHGEGNPYSPVYTRIPEDAFAGSDWLLSPAEAGENPKIYLVRSRSKAGEFAFVKRFSDWSAQAFSTPYHISDVIGAGGESSLASLSLVLQGLYKRWTGRDSNDVWVEGYLVDESSYSSLLAGKRHPMNILQHEEKSCWWEDFWDENQFRKQEYWPGWKSITERIFQVVEGRPSLKKQREQLNGTPHTPN